MDHLTAADYPTKLDLDFFSGITVDIDMKEKGRRHNPSRDLSNSHFSPSFSFIYEFLASSEIATFRSTDPITYLYQSVMM